MPRIQRHLIDSEEAPRAVELFLATPETSSPDGALLFVHGNQNGTLAGGREAAENGMLASLCSGLNIMTASVSQPGFGASEGPSDFCGPRTQDAIRIALAFLRAQPGVDAGRVVLHGLSRGAIVSAMVASKDTRLLGLILLAGSYDLAATYRAAMPGLRRAIAREAGVTDNDFHDRSPLYHAHKIRSETLIVHGRRDDRAPFEQAERMAAALADAGADASLHAVDCGHRIPREDSRAAIRPFLTRIFRQTVH
jgi:dipeptidyl aminopeptidase/acylaminoacyl peptidase